MSMAHSEIESVALAQVRFVQKAIVHGPFEDSTIADREQVLRQGSGTCGQVCLALAYLLDKCSIENRIVKLLKHIVVEARWDGRWHILDADLFRHGVIPREDSGNIPAIRDVQGSYFMDRFPPTLYVYTRDYKPYRRRAAELVPPFFHEAHEAAFMSYYYQMNLGLPPEHPPSRPKGLSSHINGRRVTLSWRASSDLDNDLVGYEVMINDKPRGWDYEDPTYENVPRDTSDKSTFTENAKIELQLDPGVYFWSVKAIDEHRKKEPRTYYFPSSEQLFEIS